MNFSRSIVFNRFTPLVALPRTSSTQQGPIRIARAMPEESLQERLSVQSGETSASLATTFEFHSRAVAFNVGWLSGWPWAC
jgi:hypothetical protein